LNDEAWAAIFRRPTGETEKVGGQVPIDADFSQSGERAPVERERPPT
jgi:hypothetical protein